MAKILIIDDSKIICERLTILFNELDNIEILDSAMNAREGMKKLNLYKPDLVILDISLPDISGIELLKTIKRCYPGCCVVILTNYPYTPYRNQCMDFGADYFFDKSQEFNKTIEVLSDLMNET